MSEVKTVENMVSITIDGTTYQAKEGEYILNAARANDVFIPAICYLTRCSPTLACRLCLVEADGKQVYACNAKVKDGMEITAVSVTRVGSVSCKTTLWNSQSIHRVMPFRIPSVK